MTRDVPPSVDRFVPTTGSSSEPQHHLSLVHPSTLKASTDNNPSPPSFQVSDTVVSHEVAAPFAHQGLYDQQLQQSQSTLSDLGLSLTPSPEN